MNLQKLSFCVLAIGLSVASISSAQPISVQFTSPTMDRWNYPFNATPGVRTTASTFGAPGDPLFDDNDAEFLLGFDTIGIVPTSQGSTHYQITSATVTVTTLTGAVFEYDPTADSYQTFLDPLDPSFIADADTGRPIELFGVGFRNGFTVDTFLEASAFQQAPAGNWQGTRNAFPTDFQTGVARDVSRHVEMLFDPAPFAVGQSALLTAGQFVPANTPWTFQIDLANSDAVAYLQQALNNGKIRLMVTSIHPAPIQGAGAQTFPDYYTRENKFAVPFGFAATLAMTVEIVNPADLNGDGVVDATDLATLLAQWGTAGAADLDNNGVVDATDLATMLANWG